MKKKAPDLQPVHHAVWQVVHPEHVTGERGRAEALEQRRGLTSELDAMWSDGRGKATPRWLWHALDHHTGTGLA